MDSNDRRHRVADEAAEWWVTLQGEVSRAQREEYVDWLRESALHVAEMLRVAQVHGALKQFERWAGIPTDGSGDDEGAIVPLPTFQLPPTAAPDNLQRPPRRVTLVRALAAVVLLAAIGLSGFLLMSTRGQIIETQRGERREVALADGSVVQVDPETRLRVKYEPTERLVALERGRALFHVAKNKERPFLVQAQDTTVRAVGTAFAVESQSGAVVVTVAEGRVAVLPTSSPIVRPSSSRAIVRSSSPVVVPKEGSAEARSSRRSATTVTEGEGTRDLGQPEKVDDSGGGSPGTTAPEIFLMAGQQLTVGGGGTTEPVRQVDSGRTLAWAEGRLVFENDSVEHVVEEFNHYNRIQLYVHDAELARRPISGTFSAEDPESFVAFLQTVTAVRVERDAAAGDISIEAK